MNSKDTGDRTEAAVLSALLDRGYSVSVPFGDNDPYDLVVDRSGSFIRVQCKTAWRNKPETIRFNTHSQTTTDGEYTETTYQGAVDAFAVRFSEGDTMFWIPVEQATKQKMELRFDGEIGHPSINWAAEYTFDEQLPSA